MLSSFSANVARGRNTTGRKLQTSKWRNQIIEVVCSENGNSEKRNYPFLVKSKTCGNLLIATGDNTGFALAGEWAFDCSGDAVSNWCDWYDKDEWEILPAGTTITLTVK